jgi:hypothetical protein
MEPLKHAPCIKYWLTGDGSRFGTQDNSVELKTRCRDKFFLDSVHYLNKASLHYV